VYILGSPAIVVSRVRYLALSGLLFL